jgi:hypothetical protein
MLRSDGKQTPCKNCGHTQYVHRSGKGLYGLTPCRAYTCNRDNKCRDFVAEEKSPRDAKLYASYDRYLKAGGQLTLDEWEKMPEIN